jgi:hypothetical protein
MNAEHEKLCVRIEDRLQRFRAIAANRPLDYYESECADLLVDATLTIQDLSSENERLRADAERYRYLKEHSMDIGWRRWTGSTSGEVFYFRRPHNGAEDEFGTMDEAIDAAKCARQALASANGAEKITMAEARAIARDIQVKADAAREEAFAEDVAETQRMFAPVDWSKVPNQPVFKERPLTPEERAMNAEFVAAQFKSGPLANGAGKGTSNPANYCAACAHWNAMTPRSGTCACFGGIKLFNDGSGCELFKRQPGPLSQPQGEKVKQIYDIVAESRKRMNTASKEMRADLEASARAKIAAPTEGGPKL